VSVEVKLHVGPVVAAPSGELVVSYVLKIDMSPPIAEVEISGSALLRAEGSEEAAKLASEAASGRLPPQLIAAIFNHTIPLASLLCRELGAPPPTPISLPAQQAEAKKEGAAFHM